MSDTMKVQSFGALLTWILAEYEGNGSMPPGPGSYQRRCETAT